MDQQFIIDALDEEILSDDFSNSDLDSNIILYYICKFLI